MSDHLKARTSDRGLHYMPEVPGTYSGTNAEVHTSSAAYGPHIWLSVRWERREHRAQAQLSADAAWRLKEQIEYLLEHHYQGDARPKRGEDRAQ